MKDLLYYIGTDVRDAKEIEKLLTSHPEVKFVSVVAVDLGNNHTDERVPMSVFMEDIEGFLEVGVQTDGSSINLPEIADINNAKVDLIPDKNVKWIVDYNYNLLTEEGRPTGTLLIPAFLKHNSKLVGSRAILKRAELNFKNSVLDLFKQYPDALKEYDLSSVDEIKDITITAATELEFWVQTPVSKNAIQKLSTSQELKEQYWQRSVGQVRSALEETMYKLDYYGFEPEMGHKEVGGVPSKLEAGGSMTHVMEQLEVDWKFDLALQSVDNELFIQDIISDIFLKHGLAVTFKAKPIEGVAGNGEHHHVGAAMKTTDGRFINLYAPKDFKGEYLSPIGWGAMMGILKNYEVINPFVSSTNDSFNRLKPGFEAPVCIVSSIGLSAEVPSRNRTVLLGLVRDDVNPLATRFELRSPNPGTNSYLAVAAIYQAKLDGMAAALASGQDSKTLEKGFIKEAGVEHFYLDTDRVYRSEENVFDDFTQEERDQIFSVAPATVVENLAGFDNNPEKVATLLKGDVFTEALLNSYKLSILGQWEIELHGRIIPSNKKIVRSAKKTHCPEDATDLDVVNWEKVRAARIELMKDSMSTKSIITQILDALHEGDYAKASDLQVLMGQKITDLKALYEEYTSNIITFC